MILVLDDDEVTGRCLVRTLKKNGFTARLYNNVIEAIAGVSEEVPEMIFMDVFLTGPDGFTFLNEMASYVDTMKVPVVIVSEKDFSGYDLTSYNVVGCLDKSTMKPEHILAFLSKVDRTGGK